MPKTAAVLGAGIQGCCAALALARLGFRVRMYDKSPAMCSRASANQEGKLHLGIVYARDRTMITARKMIHDAMLFGPVIEQLVGRPLDWEPHLSKRFYCGIHRDSSLTPEEHFSHFDKLQEIYHEIAEDQSLHYLGRRFEHIWNNEPSEEFASCGDLIFSAKTQETAVHPLWIQNVMTDSVNSNTKVSVFLNHKVDHVERRHQSFVISGTSSGENWAHDSDVVVNCLWEGRQQIDNAFGMNRHIEWATRIKYGFYIKRPDSLADIPSLIVTHGPFGDVVNFPGEKSIYLSWYPSCMTWFDNAATLPDTWEAACNGAHPQGQVEQIFLETCTSLSHFVPQLRGAELIRACAGVIMGHGKRDIDDASSELHHRHGIGVEAKGDYYSIFTGKFTSAPANSRELMQLLS